MTDVDDELRRQVRALDPARSLPPVDADALASLTEDAMSQPEPDSQSETRRPVGLSRGVLAVGLAAAAILAVMTLVNGGDDKPAERPSATGSTSSQTVTALTATSGASGKCMAPSADAVAQQPVAVEATVTSIADGLVTLEPDHFYAGEATDLVTVTAPDLRMTEMPVAFEVGKQYIVGATNGRVSICGLSGLATDELRALYERAFSN